MHLELEVHYAKDIECLFSVGKGQQIIHVNALMLAPTEMIRNKQRLYFVNQMAQPIDML